MSVLLLSAWVTKLVSSLYSDITVAHTYLLTVVELHLSTNVELEAAAEYVWQ